MISLYREMAKEERKELRNGYVLLAVQAEIEHAKIYALIEAMRAQGRKDTDIPNLISEGEEAEKRKDEITDAVYSFFYCDIELADTDEEESELEEQMNAVQEKVCKAFHSTLKEERKKYNNIGIR